MKNTGTRKLRSRMFSRSWRASWRDTSLLLREFREPLLMFAVAIIGAGLLYYFLSLHYHEPADSPVEAIYLVLTAAFLQPLGNFPHAPVLQLLSVNWVKNPCL